MVWSGTCFCLAQNHAPEVRRKIRHTTSLLNLKTKTKTKQKNPLLFTSFVVAWRYIWINYPFGMPVMEIAEHRKTNLTLLSCHILLSIQGQDENRFLSITTSKVLVCPLETELFPGRQPMVDVYPTESLPWYGSLHPWAALHLQNWALCMWSHLHRPSSLSSKSHGKWEQCEKRQACVIFCAIPKFVV